MLSLVPTFKLAEQKTELIFLVDRSGSMDGPGIGQAKQALKVLSSFVFELKQIVKYSLLHSCFFIRCPWIVT